MKKVMMLLAISLIAVAWCSPAFPMGGEHPAGVPIGQQPDWPAGLADMLNSAGRVYGYWVNANDWFFYVGDTAEFNEILKKYSALKGTPLTLVLHSAKGKTGRLGYGDKKIQYDWEVKVFTRGWHPEAPPDPTTTKPGHVIIVEVWLGGEVELAKIKVPLNVKVKSGEKNETVTKFIADHESKQKEAEKKDAGQESIEQDPKLEESAPATSDPEGAKPVAFKSDRPLYARVALDQEGRKILSVALDESQGTGTGYNVLYADVNFNRRFDNDERFEKAPPPSVRSTGLVPIGWSSCMFQPVVVNVPFNEKGQKIANPCEIIFTYQRYEVFPRGAFVTSFGQRLDEAAELLQVIERVGPKRAGPLENTPVGRAAQPQMREEFSVRCLIRLSQDSLAGQADTWQYSIEGKIKPSESLESAPVWSFTSKPTLKVETRPDGRTQGNLGIGLELSAGDKQLQCTKEGQPLKAHVEIKKPDGTVVHKGDETLDKFTFG